MKNFLMNSLIGLVAIIIGAALMAAISAFFAESFMEVVNNFVAATAILAAVMEVVIVIALLVKGIKALISLIPSKEPARVTREYSFNIWMRHYSRGREKFLKTVSVEAYSFKEAEAMMEESYPSIMFTVEAC